MQQFVCVVRLSRLLSGLVRMELIDALFILRLFSHQTFVYCLGEILTSKCLPFTFQFIVDSVFVLIAQSFEICHFVICLCTCLVINLSKH
jgi:hypothetical protein